MHKISSGAPGERLLLLGNEAIARGAIEAGVQVVAAYPGTPSSEIVETLVEFFTPPEQMEIHYRGTSIYEKTIYTVTAEIVQTLIIQSSEAKTISEVLQKFIESTEELAGIALYTEEGLPVFEEGDLADSILIPANLWLSNLDRIQDEFDTSKTYKTYLETDDLISSFEGILVILPSNFQILSIDA